MMDRASFLLGGLAALASCRAAATRLSGRGSFLPASIKIIGVPLFTNTTSLFEIEQRVTEQGQGGADRPRHARRSSPTPRASTRC